MFEPTPVLLHVLMRTTLHYFDIFYYKNTLSNLKATLHVKGKMKTKERTNISLKKMAIK